MECIKQKFDSIKNLSDDDRDNFVDSEAKKWRPKLEHNWCFKFAEKGQRKKCKKDWVKKIHNNDIGYDVLETPHEKRGNVDAIF